MRFLVAGLVVFLLGALVVPVAGAGGEPNVPYACETDPVCQQTTRMVCVESGGLAEVACAIAQLNTTWSCWQDAAGFYCDTWSMLSLTVQGGDPSSSVHGYAVSQALPNTTVEAGPGELVRSPWTTVRHRGMPDGGTTFVFQNKLCIQFTLPDNTNTTQPATTEPSCQTWPHAVWIIGDVNACGSCNDWLAQDTGYAGIAHAKARNTATSTGALEHDRSTEHVCGTNTRIDIGCGAARVLHSTPSCTESTGTRTCTIDYWLEVAISVDGGCALAWTDHFPAQVTNCLDDASRDCEDLAPGVRRCEPDPDYRLAGPFTVTYTGMPVAGMKVDVWAHVCLGNGNPQGWDDRGYTHCTVWSPATIHLPGA